MNRLMKLSAYSEIIASIAVIVSLIYVGLQVQQNTYAIQTSTSQSLYVMNQENQSVIVSNRAFAELTDKIKKGNDPISSVDSTQWLNYLNMDINVYESAYTNMTYGTLDREMGESWLTGIKNWVCTPMAYYYWNQYNEGYVQGFQDLVDQAFEEHPECRE